MKKLNLLSKAEMKMIVGGSEPVGGSGTCNYRCCTDQHTNCSDYRTNGRACNSANDCANPIGEGCSGGEHLYWNCL